MFIEKIIISRFRSFHYCTIENLSPGQNVFIGSNGSGKSNLLLALEFVLSKNYAHLSQEEKIWLICNQNDKQNHRKQKLIETFVEIHFNNQDGHFPLNNKTVVIKRRIDEQSDRYYLNNKLTKHDDIMTLLKSAGFAVDNSYFIVKQNMIADIAISSPSAILGILRSMSGETMFEQKMATTIQLNDECKELLAKIDEQLANLNSIVQWIHIQPNTVEQYNRLLKLKKYLIVRKKHLLLKELITEKRLKKELKHSNDNELEHCQQKTLHNKNCLNDLQNKFQQTSEEISHLKEEFETKKLLLQTLIKELSDLSDNQQNDKDDFQYDLTEINEFEEQLFQEEDKFNIDKENYFNLIESGRKMQRKLQLLNDKRMNYYYLIDMLQKTPSSSIDQFVHERYLEPLASNMELTSNLIMKFRQQLQELKSEKNHIEKLAKIASKETSSKLTRMKPLTIELESLVCEQKKNHVNQLKVMSQFRQLQKEFIEVENELKQVEMWLDSHSSQMAIASRRSIKQVMDIFRSRLLDIDNHMTDNHSDSPDQRQAIKNIFDGYYGQIIDCFQMTCPVEYAMEALFKNKLFFHLVRDENVALAITQEITRHKLNGKFEFLVVNRMPHLDQESLNPYEQICKPLMSCIKINSNESVNNDQLNDVEMALSKLFNGLYIVRTFEDCCRLFQTSGTGLNNNSYSTIHGEMIDQNGIIHKICKDRPTKIVQFERWLKLSKRYEQIKFELKQLQDKHDCLLKRSNQIHQELTLKRQEMDKLKDWFQECNHQRQNVLQNETTLQTQLLKIEQQINLTRRNLNHNETQMSCLMERKNFWEKKLKNKDSIPDFLRLFEEEFRKDFDEQIQDVHRELISNEKHRILKMNQIENDQKLLNDSKRKLNLMKFIQQQQQQTNSEEKVQLLQKWNAEIEQTENTINQLHQRLIRLSQEKSQLDNQIQKLNNRHAQLNSDWQLQKKKCLLQNKQLHEINDQIDMAKAYIQENGLFTQSFHDQLPESFEDLESIQQVNRELKELSRQIKHLTGTNELSVGHLNEYNRLMEDRNLLIESKMKQIDMFDLLSELISLIEMQKKEMVFRTYKQVNMNFQNIFKHFVPNGCARLDFMMRTNDINELNGIKMFVSFTNEERADSDLMSLSTGQKSLVTLTFILALQKVDPMPLYALDELDQSLDENTRSLVADMIHLESKKKQFLLTTFRKEMLINADRLFRVFNVDGISQVVITNREDAIDFVTNTLDDTSSNQIFTMNSLCNH